MNDRSTTQDNLAAPAEPDGELRQVGTLGVSPAGESYEVVRLRIDEETDEQTADRFVLKKLTRARLRSPQRFQQKFDALCRLDHDSLCPYRELFIGEKATRITRDYVEGLALDDYLNRPITDEEQQQLAQMTEGSGATGELDGADTISQEGNTDSDIPPEEPLEDPHDPSAPDDTQATPEFSETLEEPANDTSPPEEPASGNDSNNDRPSTLEIPTSLLEDSEAANRALDLIILRLQRVLPQLVDTLEYLHRFGQVHGNLTPSNVLITPDGEVVLTDYGLHPELYISPATRRRHTTYHAPEVDGGEFLPESDLYSLGAILFEALADRPYGARRKKETPNGNGTEFSPVYLSEIVPHCPASWVDLIHAMLASSPDERPSLDEVHRQLAATETRSVNIPASVVDDPDTLYGRRKSLDRLIERSQWSSQNHTLNLSLVEGETGVGKTALLDALARQSAQRGWVVLHGRCFHREPIAYQGWEKVVDRLVTITGNLPDKPRQRLRAGCRRASRIFPKLLPDGEQRPDIGRRAAVDGFRHVLTELSQQRPILICFDDIHWAARDSTRLLADLAEDPQGMRIMVVATWRPGADTPGDEHPFWSELKTAPVDVERIAIEGFSKEEARRYVLTHGTHLSLRQKQKVLRRGGLNPLLIDELIHELHEDSEATAPSAVDDKQEANTEHREQQEEDGTEVDHYLRAFIEQRISQLNRAERLVLQLLAIASGPLNPRLLARAMEREIGTQTADLVSGREVAESLVEQRLARRARRLEPSTDESPRYVVIHDLCRDVVLDELGRDHHARLCGLIADAMASGSAQTDDLRFEYLLRAGRGEEASRAAVLAARTALDRFAFHRATRLWGWLADRDDFDDRDRPDFTRALFGAGRFRRAVEELDRLLPSSAADTDLRRRRRRSEAFLAAGSRDDAIEAIEEAMAAASTPYIDRSVFDRFADLQRRITTAIGRWCDAAAVARDQPPDDATLARARLYDFALRAAPFLRTEPTCHLERRFARIAADSRYGPLVARDRLSMIGAPYPPFLLRDDPKFDRWTDQVETIAEQFDRRDLRVQQQEMRALLARHRGDIDTAVEQLDCAREEIESGNVSDPSLYARLLKLRIDTMLQRGRVDAAKTLARRAIHHFRHHQWLLADVYLTTCDVELLAGNLEEADNCLQQVRRFIGDNRNCLVHLWLMQRQTRLYIARGQAEVAVGEWDLLIDRVYSRRLRRRPRARMLIYSSLSCALAALAERQQTLGEPHLRETLRRLRRSVRRFGDLEDWMGCIERSRLYRLRSRVALLRKRPQRALRHARNAAEAVGDDAPELVDAINQEAIAVATTAMEQSSGRQMLDEARRRQQKLGVYLPLVLEGWPVPRANARLGDDS